MDNKHSRYSAQLEPGLVTEVNLCSGRADTWGRRRWRRGARGRRDQGDAELRSCTALNTM